MDYEEDFFDDACDEMFPLLMESVSAYSKIRDCFVDIIETGKKVDAEYAHFARAQMHFFSSRVHSLTLLLQNWQLWDADILMRSAIECATRFLFICTRNATERSQCMEEFNVSLFEIHRIERSEKANRAARHAVDVGDKLMFRGATLKMKEEIELRSRWPKAKRKALKQKWSFSELVSVLELINDPTINLSAYSSLQHSYALGSHFVHADATAVALARDRAERGQEERLLLERAHFARLAVEPTALFFLCLKGAAHALQLQLKNAEISRAISRLYEKSTVYHRDFFASQADFYDSVDT